jgi:amidophosphoribosyltransferase
VNADLITPVPESGRIYDQAFGFKLGIPVEDGLFRNRHDDARTFLADRETDRRKMQRKKIHPLREVIQDKDICLVEDSLVRGSVIPETIAMCRKVGAVRVHVRIGSAPIRFPCYYGIDMATREELAANGNSTAESIRQRIFADSLGYLSIDGMVQATGVPKENLCLACFDGNYPVPPPVETA